MNLIDFPILLWPDPRLKMVSVPVKTWPGMWSEDNDVALAMQKIMEQHHGAGLAAIQIGIPKRIVVSKFCEPMFNPAITGWVSDRVPVREGCLSLPDIFETVHRHPGVQVTYTSMAGAVVQANFTGQAAQCFQHEMEHLDGHFFTDNLPSAERSRIRGEVTKLKRQGKWK